MPRSAKKIVAFCEEWKDFGGMISWPSGYTKNEQIVAEIEDNNLNSVLITELNLSWFFEKIGLKIQLRNLFIKHNKIFEAFECIERYKHSIKLTLETHPICTLCCRSFLKKEKMKRECMNRLLNMGVVEYFVSTWLQEVFLCLKRTAVPS